MFLGGWIKNVTIGKRKYIDVKVRKLYVKGYEEEKNKEARKGNFISSVGGGGTNSYDCLYRDLYILNYYYYMRRGRSGPGRET